MTEEEFWSAAAATVQAEYSALPATLKQDVAFLATQIGSLKETASSLVAAGTICAACQGICCRFGKHHFSVIDRLAYLVSGQDLFTPDFANPICPYHAGSGCVMAPALRPLSCTIFICEQIEESLADAVKLELAAIEHMLRRHCADLEQLLGNRFENGLLITYERSLRSGGTIFSYSSERK